MWGDLGGGDSVAPAGKNPAMTVEQMLHAAVRQSIEGMAFMPVEPAEMLIATLPVVEPVEGQLLVVLSQRVARSLTVSVQACEPSEITDQMLKDFVAELSNLIAGQLLSMLVGDDQVFHLGVPTVSMGGLRMHDKRACSTYFLVDGSPLEVVISGAALVELLSGKATS